MFKKNFLKNPFVQIQPVRMNIALFFFYIYSLKKKSKSQCLRFLWRS